MTEAELEKYIEDVSCADLSAIQKARERQSRLAKPPQSLGGLEDIAVKLSGITGKVFNSVEKRRVAVFCSDNGVCEEGVSSAPQSVTLSQAINMTRSLTGMSAMAKHFGDDVRIIDVGIASDYYCPGITDKKIAYGTKNLHTEPAMTRDQALLAITAGIEQAELAKRDGINLLGCGEMGIGNTTTSSAVLSALTGIAPQKLTGRGGGLTDQAFEKKKLVIEEALALHKPDPSGALDVLSKVGGFDIAAMCGLFIGAAHERIPAVIDGFISVTAALCAARLCPAVKDFLLASHSSFEIGYSAAAKELGVRPFLDLGMRLGEGSGCVAAFRIIEAACAFTNEMATFEEASINDGYLDEIRAKDSFTVK